MLCLIFSADSQPKHTTQEGHASTPCLVDILGNAEDLDFECCENDGGDNVDTDSEEEAFKAWCLTLVITMAKQLSVEDQRVTGFSYEQWWSSQFASSPLEVC